MTLLTYVHKYVNQSAATVQSTSTTFSDDTGATRTFTIASKQTILVIYAVNGAHGNANSVYGFKSAISIDGTDHSIMSQSAYAANYSLRNTCVWVGTLAAGEHTIVGRIACNVASTTTTISNHTLLIYILDGDEFTYVEDTTAVTLQSTTYVDDSYASVTATPSGACKALIFYGVSNNHGVTERYVGKKIMINTGGTDRTASEMFQSGYNTGTTNADSNTTAWAESISATSRTFKGRWAGNGAQLTTISRRFFCVLFFADSTILDVDTDTTAVASTSTTLSDDGNISITRSHEGELLCIYAATKATGTTSAIYGTQYGIMLDSADVATSRSAAAYSSDGHQALITYAATVAAGSHTIKGRMSTNYATTATYATKKIMIALWFPVKTLLTYQKKYVIQSKDLVTATDSTLIEDTPASVSFTFLAQHTLLVFYNANSDFGDTNNVGGFKNAINVDGTNYALMHASGYAADHPMRNTCVWVGSVEAGAHTIKGMFASNQASTTTSISNRTLLIYVFNGDAFTYIDSTTAQVLAASETFVDDTAALISSTPPSNCKALVFYGVTNVPGTTEHYVGKKIQIAVNDTDYPACEARQSSYSSGGTNPDSVATAYALPLTGGTNYTFKGRAASIYNYATYISRRFFAVLLFADTTVIDIDSSTTSENTASATLVDDPDILISRNTMGELLVFYAATKTSFTNSDIQGNRYGIMLDGYDVAESRTSQAYSGSANSCLVGMASTVYSQNHTLKGRFSANEDTGTVYITGRCMTALWLPRTVVSATFENTHDVRLSKNFIGRNDINIKKIWSSYNAITAQTLINTYFEATSDIKVSRIYANSNDERLSKLFVNTDDIKIYRTYVETNDIKVNKYCASSNDERLSKTISVITDIKVLRTWESYSDEHLSKYSSAYNDIILKLSFAAMSDIKALYTWAYSNSNNIKALYTWVYENSNDIKALYTWAYYTFNDIKALYKWIYAETNDIIVSKQFTSSSDEALSKAISAITNIQVLKTWGSSNDTRISRFSSSYNDISLKLNFITASDIAVLHTWSSFNDERLSTSSSAYNDIALKLSFTTASDIKALYKLVYSNFNDIELIKVLSSTSDIESLYTWAYSNSNNIKLIKAFSSTSDLKLIKAFQSLSDALYSTIISSHDDILQSTSKSSSNDLKLIKAFSTANDLTLHQAFEASMDILLALQKEATSDIRTHSINDSTSDIRLSKALDSANDILEAFFVQSTNDISLYELFSSHNEILGMIWTQFISSNNIQISKAFESYSDIIYSDAFSSANDIKLLKQFAVRNDILRTNIKLSRNDIRLTKYWTSRGDIKVYKVWDSINRLWLYSVKSSSNDLKIAKNFVNSNDLVVYKTLASTHDVFVKKNFSDVSKIKVDHYVESSNNVLLEKEFESTNDVLEFLQKLYASTNSVLLVEEFLNSSNINIEKTFSSTNTVVKVIWDLTYPLTVVISQSERTVVISAISREIFIDELLAKTTTIDSQNRTVTVDQSDRGVTINKW
ncbi:MAG: hypothetical protein M0P26_00210 [Bacteroidales bacterium]|nr:hypothetical protein [Bacteroidales bacterium]